MWTLSWPKGKAHFRYEITPKTRVHEKEKISSNSGHILGYANLGFENNITLKWPPETQLSLNLSIYDEKGPVLQIFYRTLKILSQ